MFAINIFYDSLILKEIFDFNTVTNLCDVGSGAGFPSFPLKILFPHLKIVIIESSLKKINFLKQLASYLELDNICFFHQRVEQMAVMIVLLFALWLDWNLS